ncbi:hypothetical protein BX600DRAFT_516679 [Xylariales sp. PMI_506]|nr:hypothetical protein BX600DRAFT_516679 [Xylariales sp. PMI_506]
MSAVKFGYQPYKLFEPQFHTERPIIVDDAVESPETVTLRYEEEAAARATGGGLRGDSPTGLLPASTYSKPQPPQMHAFESSRSYPDPHYQYPAQPFSAQQTENAASQLNQMAFSANSSAGQYMAPVVPSVISCQPSSGVCGTKVTIKISAPYDLISVATHFYLAFGQQRCAAHAVRDAHDASGYGFLVSGEAPPFEDTRSPSDSVPLSLLIEIPDSQPPASIDAGTFTYHDSQVGPTEAAHEDVTRGKVSQSPEHRQSPPKEEAQLPDAATNTYGYPPGGQPGAASAYDPSYGTNNGNMLEPYHRSSYATDYSRQIPPPIKAPSPWSGYGTSLSSMRSPAITHASHTAITRPSITSLPAPSGSAPQLVRTSTLQNTGSPSSSFNPYALYSAKAVLKIAGDLDSMASNWTKEEWDNRRRIVLFRKHQQGSTLTASFKPVSVNERPTNSICISCIYWAEKSECYVTSVDTIHLLEQLVAAPARFTVEEKNRIRRNLEGFRPLTVSKAKPDSEEFFKIIMAFPNPKPRNIEKDVKVFPWKILAQALKKIISKYSASPSSTLPPGPSPSALLTPVSSNSPGMYPHGPQTPTVADGSYGHHDHHAAGALTSPRSLSGVSSNWANAGYAAAARPLSPSLKTHSPTAGAGMRMPGLPTYGAPQPNDGRHHSASATPTYGIAPQPTGRWEGATSYLDATGGVPAYASHQHHHQSQVYGAGGYADGSQRA